MAFVFKDRVQETTATSGTGAFALAGAVASYRTFSSVMSNGDTCRYCAVDSVANTWEIGIGTYNTGSTLSRSVVQSSNSNALVSFAGNSTTTVFITLDATYLTSLIPSIVTSLIYG